METMTENESDRAYIADEGTDCPTFVAERTIGDASDNKLHTVRLTDPMSAVETRDTETVITMAVDTDGGIIEYDDGVTIYRRLFDYLEHAMRVFRDTVDETVEEYERQGVEFEFEYSPGIEPVSFETQT
jgi:hypothetical protein